MRNLLRLPAAVVLVLSVSMLAVAQTATPNLHELKLVTQLPPKLPQRILGLAYDGEQIWAMIYHGKGHYAKLDPSTLKWTISGNEKEHNRVIPQLAGGFENQVAACFANGTLWVAGAYGESFGSIHSETWQVERLFKGKHRVDSNASQLYSSMAYDGTNLWIAWHWFKYDRPATQTQLLLKIDPENGKVIAEYPAPSGRLEDGAHGLTWDGTRLWHMKDQRLSAIDPSTGAVTAQYVIEGPQRPSGLAWVKDALWIADFGGQIWRLPFGQ